MTIVSTKPLTLLTVRMRVRVRVLTELTVGRDLFPLQ